MGPPEGNPPETIERSESLRRALDPRRALLGQIPGCNSNGIGLTAAAFARLRSSAEGPESVRPEDMVITVGFETHEYMDAGRARVDDILGDLPHECKVIGRQVLL